MSEAYYNRGAICTDSSPESIKKAIDVALLKKEQLVKEMMHLKEERLRDWDERFSDLTNRKRQL